MTEKIVLTLNIESFKGILHGSTLVADNLITETASSEEQLEQKLHEAISTYHGLKINEYYFHKKFHLSYFFTKFDFLKISKVAALAGINSSLLRQYVNGTKLPSEKQTLKVRNAIAEIIRSLSTSEII